MARAYLFHGWREHGEAGELAVPLRRTRRSPQGGSGFPPAGPSALGDNAGVPGTWVHRSWRPGACRRGGRFRRSNLFLDGGTGCLARAWHAAGVVRSPARGGPVSSGAISSTPGDHVRELGRRYVHPFGRPGTRRKGGPVLDTSISSSMGDRLPGPSTASCRGS